VGTKFDAKNNAIYGVSHEDFTLEKSLAEKGLTTADITDVFCTHLHFDHAGGNTFYDEEGQLQMRFPNAVYHINRFHYEWALNPSRRDKASFFPENYEFLVKNGYGRLYEPSEKLFENCSFLSVHGHSPHQTLIRIADDENTLLHCGDMIPTSSHVPLPFVMGYDLNALQTLSEKEILLFDAAEKNWILFFGHDPNCSSARVEMTEKQDFRVTERLSI
jgi:glyoxylase-like metal-dependent hydrolase (beta-lactamase superfamily II)